MKRLIVTALAILVASALHASEPLREAIRNYIENKPEHNPLQGG